MKKMLRKYPISSLIALALLSGLLWRIEVELHGWTGLIWLSYFHLAIPVGFGLFLAWANLFIKVNWGKRALLNVAAIAYGILIYYGLGISLTYVFAGGQSGFLLAMQTPEWQLILYRYAIFILIPFIPFGAYLILKAFKSNPNPKFLALAVVGIIVSIPLSVLALEVINHKGGQDIIHSVKSGMLIPFWLFSMGILIIGQKSRNTNTQSSRRLRLK